MSMRMKIQDRMKKGMKPKMAIAESLAEAYKEKKMSMGGMVDSQMDSDDGTSMKPGEPTYPMGDDEQGLSPNVMSAQELAEGLQARKMSANPTVSFEADAPAPKGEMDSAGLEVEEDSSLGAKPTQPMPSSSITEDAKRAIQAARSRNAQRRSFEMARKK